MREPARGRENRLARAFSKVFYGERGHGERLLLLSATIMAPRASRRTIMPVFPIRLAPSLKWMARTAEPRGVHALRQGGGVLRHHAAPKHESGVRATCCGIELPDAYALRLEARTHATPHNPVGCPLEGSALRLWCVRKLQGECPRAGACGDPRDSSELT
ncbi:hypothetical protein [Paraburkholderia pallida]|uniref:Uncharacterized protein n=1 Tax=Paraburkholderia pallida TaxID=2547399 RepID=A0A4P7CY11_9BURK|nr:hypothetical protein [Paraburkholderia pallida]QBQ99209.1 hypothetical protein E1956_18555 [Paraburkholderia pallida]